MDNHIRQTQQPGALYQSGKKPANRGFAVEYALYMMDLVDLYNIGNTSKTALSPDAFERSEP
jgi:hypothetical protein